jgi:hypothetical protein
MNNRIRITVGSEPDHDDLVGDIYFDDEILCSLTQDGEVNNVLVRFHGAKGSVRASLRLEDFEAALQALKRRLWELRRVE